MCEKRQTRNVQFRFMQNAFRILKPIQKSSKCVRVFRSTGANAFAKIQMRLAYEDKRDLYCMWSLYCRQTSCPRVQQSRHSVSIHTTNYQHMTDLFARYIIMPYPAYIILYILCCKMCKWCIRNVYIMKNNPLLDVCEKSVESYLGNLV